MVSFRNFISICITMAAMFFLFQFLQISRESGSDYNTNEYLTENVLSGSDKWEAGDGTDVDAVADADILFMGIDVGGLSNVIGQWCTYTKRSLAYAESVEEMKTVLEGMQPEMILIDGTRLDLPKDEEALSEIAGMGIPVAFVQLPQVQALEESRTLQSILGIDEIVSHSAETEGIQLYSGFLLGGTVVYTPTWDTTVQDLEFTMPWYGLNGRTQVFMAGLMTGEGIEQDMLPPVMWRHSYRGNIVFAVNGDYILGLAGLGFLDAFAYEAKEYDLYPVVNAESTVVTSFPGFARENEERLMELYSRNPSALQQEIIWPGFTAISSSAQRIFTCFFMPQYDYGDEEQPSGSNLDFYLEQLKELDGEAGWTLEHGGSITLPDKLNYDQQFWEQNNLTYRFSAFYIGGMEEDEITDVLDHNGLKDIRTLAGSYREGGSVLSYFNDEITFQSVTGDAGSYTYAADLQKRALETALGYSNLLIDMQPVLWPESEADQWENYLGRLYNNLGGHWNLGDGGFEGTTLTESDKRVRNMLNLDYSHIREGNTILLDVENVEEAWFILRTHGEGIGQSQGAEYKQLEAGAYLIHVLAPHAELLLESENIETEYYFSR